MLKVLVDVDAMFGGKAVLENPQCNISFCDRTDGDFRNEGVCYRHKWCPHARRDPKAVESYRDPDHFRNQLVYSAVKPALEKMQRCNCRIAFWTTRPKNQTCQIIEALKRAEVWDDALLISERVLLHTEDLPFNFDYSVETTKLTILERSFGKDLVSNRKIVAIEADPLEAAILKNYQPSLTVLMAPMVWLNVIAADEKQLPKILVSEYNPVPSGKEGRRTINESPSFDI